MIDLKMFKDGITIVSKFGIKHALNRYKDMNLMKKEEKRRTNLYNRIKPKGAVIKNILGNRMQLDMNDYGIHRDLFLDGIKEPMATHHMKEILSENDIVLEIGANIGYYALIESKICKKVYAIEPYPKNIQNLIKNVALNQCKNIEVFGIALGDKKGSQLMNISPKSNWHSFYPIKDAVCKEYVEMDTSDNFLRDKEPPAFIRMDVEGYELYILKGAKETLKQIDRLFIEIHSQIMTLKETRELIRILKKEGFLPEKIIKYDKPLFGRILPNNHIEKIYQGDKGTYEVFFRR